MSDPTAAAAPGWYPDASGNQRWWDGRGWTEHVAAPAPAAAATQYERPPLAEGTRVDTIWVWLVATLLVVSVIPLFFFDFNGYMRAVMDASLNGSSAVSSMFSYLTFYLVTAAIGWATYAFIVVSAFRDYKHLQAVGVVRPFHWAFAFIAALVYLIGRHVVLRKVTRTSGAPLWVHVALNVLLVIGSLIWTFVLIQTMFNDIASSYPYDGSFS